jgi:hypothetical protein
VLGLVVLGVVGVYNSREYRDHKINVQGDMAPKTGMTTPWFEGFAVDACGKLLPPIKTTKDPYGLTIKDGVIYIQPTVKAAAGHNATLAKLASSIGMTLNAAQIQVPGGHLYQAGDNCEGKPGQVYVMTWASSAVPPQDGVLQKQTKSINPKLGEEDTCSPDCESGVLLENEQLVTVALLPPPKKGHVPAVLQPPQSVRAELTKLIQTGGTTTTSTPALTVPKTVKGVTTTVGKKSVGKKSVGKKSGKRGKATSTKTSKATTGTSTGTSTTGLGTSTTGLGTSTTGLGTSTTGLGGTKPKAGSTTTTARRAAKKKARVNT